ncbi:MAG TPA: hypothetical protein PKO05_00515 [Thermoanaerobaculia bacterium]|jgi:hypothetical protein|nr:MAG: putative zinc ribbon domain protein [Acidobacteria bacterium ADurb.Bin051]HNU81898.1 hypothetical protein [Thermoanaerobaculia bacterium]
MNPQIQELLVLQELDALLADLGEAAMREREAALGFPLGESTRLSEARAEAAARIDARVLRLYERIRQRHPRAVAPSLGGTCLGCFTVRPTAMASRQSDLETCERCGRILFRLEEERHAPAASAAAPPARKRAVTRKRG